MGTKINNIKKSIKKGTIIFFNMEVSNAENTNIIKKANTVKNEAEIQLRRHDIDVVFKAPWYKIEVGHYINENIVQTAAEKIQRFYPNAIKVRSQIIAPENKD